VEWRDEEQCGDKERSMDAARRYNREKESEETKERKFRSKSLYLRWDSNPLLLMEQSRNFVTYV